MRGLQILAGSKKIPKGRVPCLVETLHAAEIAIRKAENWNMRNPERDTVVRQEKLGIGEVETPCDVSTHRSALQRLRSSFLVTDIVAVIGWISH
jgi:hypothetical protein